MKLTYVIILLLAAIGGVLGAIGASEKSPKHNGIGIMLIAFAIIFFVLYGVK